MLEKVADTIAKDRQLSDWEKFFPVEPKTPDGKQANIKHWDPDCFLIGDNYTFVVQRASNRGSISKEKAVSFASTSFRPCRIKRTCLS
jgi:hypothetical protein